MKRIGLLGGMSWESSIEYERLINEGVRAVRGGVASADLVIRSYDFATIEALQAADDWDAAGDLLAADARMHDFYRRRLEGHGLQVIVPDEPARTVVHDVIYDELVRGVVSAESKQRYLGIIERLVDGGAEGVIAGCTEIELLVGVDDVAVPYFPTTRIHADAAVAMALGAG